MNEWVLKLKTSVHFAFDVLHFALLSMNFLDLKAY